LKEELFSRKMEKVEKYIRDEKMEKEKINEIVLVGG
jgi:molecular chaperone DnaK (HSP70)